MKQLQQLKPLFSAVKQPALWWGLLLAILLAGVVALVAHQLFFAQTARIQWAFDNNQRVIINVKTGEVSTGSPQAKKLRPDDAPAKLHPEDDQNPSAPQKASVTPTGAEEAPPITSGAATAPTTATAPISPSTDPAVTPPTTTPAEPAATTSAPTPAASPPVADTSAPAAADAATPPPAEEAPPPVTSVGAAPTDAVAVGALPGAVQTLAPTTKPRIAVVVVGLGLSRAMTEKAVSMDPRIALGFSSYAYNLPNWIQTAKRAKHVVLLNVAMEPVSYPADDPGPHALLTSQSDKENLKKLQDLLKMAEGGDGLYSIRDEKFSLSVFKMTPILKEMKAQKTLYIYGGEPSNYAIVQLAEQLQAPLLAIDELIDERLNQEAMQQRLFAAEQKALMNGKAVVMGRAYPITLRLLEAWIPTLQAKGIQVVTVGELRK